MVNASTEQLLIIQGEHLIIQDSFVLGAKR